MHHYQLYIFPFILLIILNINGLTLSKNQKSTEIQLEPPHLSDKFRIKRPPIKPSTNIIQNRNKPKPKSKPKIVSDKDLYNPCNGKHIKTNGTTCGLREIMMGRCYEYQYIKHALFLTNQSDVKNCTELYETFESAVRYKPYCNINMSTYERYFELALTGVHVINRAMFWSGTYMVAHAYSASGINYITLEDTLAATMVNGLVWCGKENDTDGFDFYSCPNNCKDNQWADLAFWGLASKTFAQLVVGEIYVILNGSQRTGQPTFRNNSYFALFELPNFRQNGTYRVTKINVLVLHSPDHPVIERCGEKSLIILESLIRNKGFDYVCNDDPEELILIMCADQWEARECQIARRVLQQAWHTKLHGISNSNKTSFSLIIIFISLFYSKLFFK